MGHGRHGDTVLLCPFTRWLWKFGFEPQISLKTRTDEILDGPSWGAGPTAVLTGPITENITFAGILGQLRSFDGDFSTITVQPAIFYNFDVVPDLYVGYNGIIAMDWKMEVHFHRTQNNLYRHTGHKGSINPKKCLPDGTLSDEKNHALQMPCLRNS